MTSPSGAVRRKSNAPPPAKQAAQSSRFMNPVSASAFSKGVAAFAASLAALLVTKPMTPTQKYHKANKSRAAIKAYFLTIAVRPMTDELSLSAADLTNTGPQDPLVGGASTLT